MTRATLRKFTLPNMSSEPKSIGAIELALMLQTNKLKIMKTKTKFGECYVFFAYESPDCNEYFGNYDDAVKEWGETDLGGFCYSPYFGKFEPIDYLHLTERPKLSQVKEFIANCYKILEK